MNSTSKIERGAISAPPVKRKRKRMNKELLIEALEIAISHFDYDQEWFKADELRDYRDQLKKEGESK
jgi:hypothetical protein